MNSWVANAVCCAWLPCCQPGTDIVELAGYPVDFCPEHAERMRELQALRDLEVTEPMGATEAPEGVPSTD